VTKTVVNPEYLRRNLLHCSSIGALASIDKAIERLEQTKRPPKWLLKMLRDAQERAAKLPPALACYRSAAPVHIPVVSCEPSDIWKDIPGLGSGVTRT
jgi:hypothetical protein